MSDAYWLCPHCGTKSSQALRDVAGVDRATKALHPIPHLQSGLCPVCNGVSVEYDGLTLHPQSRLGPPPSPDLPEKAAEVFEEARRVGPISPRAAVALLRLALEIVVKQVQPGAHDLNAGISELVGQGLPAWTQQAMDAVRVSGNDAVHAGQILMHEDTDIVLAMFQLVNVVVEYTITLPRLAEDAYVAIPDRLRAIISMRDAPRPKD